MKSILAIVLCAVSVQAAEKPLSEPVPFRFAETFMMLMPNDSKTKVLTAGIDFGIDDFDGQRRLQIRSKVSDTSGYRCKISKDVSNDNIDQITINSNRNNWTIQVMDISPVEDAKLHRLNGVLFNVTYKRFVEKFELKTDFGATLQMECASSCVTKLGSMETNNKCGKAVSYKTREVLQQLGINLPEKKEEETQKAYKPVQPKRNQEAVW